MLFFTSETKKTATKTEVEARSPPSSSTVPLLNHEAEQQILIDHDQPPPSYKSKWETQLDKFEQKLNGYRQTLEYKGIPSQPVAAVDVDDDEDIGYTDGPPSEIQRTVTSEPPPQDAPRIKKNSRRRDATAEERDQRDQNLCMNAGKGALMVIATPVAITAATFYATGLMMEGLSLVFKAIGVVGRNALVGASRL